MVNCATIPAGEAFARRLAEWILETHGADASMAGVLVLLPNRRSVLALRQAFLECVGGKPLILPRIQPIGDIEQEETLWGEAAELPPAMPELRRRLLLMRLIMRLAKVQGVTMGRQLAELAEQLAHFIDDAVREEIDLDRLSLLAPEEFAVHWQGILDFLKLVSHHWPLILQQEGLLDPARWRYRQLKAIAQSWKHSPPPHPVIAAGSTGSHPATAALLAAIARLPKGMVVLPGLDTDMPENEWEQVAETHPQFGLKQLLERMGVVRSAVQLLASQQPTTNSQQRLLCLRTVFQPPEITSGWAKAAVPTVEGLTHVQIAEAETGADEARLIAVALRETLETPGKTAALVTPDRRLARMVAQQMERFGIAIDDSAGRPLADTPPGCFLRLALEMAASGAAPSELLAGLRHPLAAAGRSPAQCRALSRTLEMELLRGVRPAPGIKALHDAAPNPAVKHLLADLENHLRPLKELFRRKTVTLESLLKAHVAFAEWLASSDDETGEARLWKGDAGGKLASFVAEIMEQADALPPIDPAAYPGLFEALLSDRHWWPGYGLHPRLHILSPMEARLQHYDRVILGSLNEGTWPRLWDADPWMSRPMRRALGLPAPEREIGQSAHDMFMLAAMPDVLITRARKVEGAPTVPSRWLVRLETFVRGRAAALWQSMDRTEHYRQALAQLDAPLAMTPLSPPAPVPPLKARPKQMGVTGIDTWLADPYVTYARYVLKLKALDPLDQDPGAADFGTVVHRALEEFTHRWPCRIPEDAYAKLLECGRRAFNGFIDRPAVAALWWPRFEEVARWVAEMESLRRQSLEKVLGETEGRWRIETEGEFTLTARIDRLEIGKDGAVTLADYKTGAIPKDSMQLPLMALVASGMFNRKIDRLEYWKLGSNAQKCEIKPADITMEEAHERLIALLRRFENPQEPYAAQTDRRMQLAHNDYEHLTRRQEWMEG